MTRANQGGSVAGFVVVAALLVLSTAGLLYFVKRGDTPQPVTPVAVTNDKEKKSSNSNGSGQVVDEGADSSRTSNRKSEDNQPSTNSTKNTPPVTELSRTGPTETFAQIMMMGVLVASLVAYLQSRQQHNTVRSSL